jgi:hypothetical protein
MNARDSFSTEESKIEERVALAHLRAERALTSQDRQHYQGMADYWAELLAELRAGPAAA